VGGNLPVQSDRQDGGQPIEARFVFRDGKIAEHRDHFDLWRWARQALGSKGLLLGWAAPVQNAIRRQAAKGLGQFRASR
jgi:hypothetical protein